MNKDNKTLDKQQNDNDFIADVRQRLLNTIINIVGDIEEKDSVLDEGLDDLDFLEIVIEAELQFDCTIKEGQTRIDDFEKVSDLVDWLASNVIKSVCDLYSTIEDCDRFRFRKYEGCKHCRYKQTVL